MNSKLSLLICLLYLNSSLIFSSCEKAHSSPTLSQVQDAWEQLQNQQAHLLKQQQKDWVDSVLNTLSLTEQIAQLFMVATYYQTPAQIKATETLIQKQGIGGLIFFKGGPTRQAQLTNHYQKLSKIPLLVGLDAEWGLNMRLDSTINFPKQMTLGALQNDSLIYLMGLEIGRQLRRIGVHINFAPVVDVNNNAKNPVIGFRSFGENPLQVAEKGIEYMLGLQTAGIIANAKHFPGHGDTNQDSHLTLPVIKHDTARLNQIELYPFKKIIAAGIESIMIAHLHVPALGSKPRRPTTLSPSVVSQKLRDELNFKGLIITDALNMKGVSQFYSPGEVDLQALRAGNDLLLFSVDPAEGIKMIKEAVENGDSILTPTFIAAKARKILAAKFRVGLNRYKPIVLDNLNEDLNRSKSLALKQQLFEESLTLVKNQAGLLPIRNLSQKKIAFLNINLEAPTTLKTYLNKYTNVAKFDYTDSDRLKLSDTLSKYDLVITGFETSIYANRTSNIRPNTLRFLQSLAKKTGLITVLFGSPYHLKFFEKSKTLICAYEPDPLMQKVVAQALLGALKFKGKLPISVSDSIKIGAGVQLGHLSRLGFSYPEAVGLSSTILKRIDTIAEEALANRATPGCQVLVAKDGKVVFQKNYGYQTYQQQKPITDETIYDLASLTKVLATLQAVMLLDSYDLLNIDSNVETYLPNLKDHDEGTVQIRQVLGHQAGLIPFIQYWLYTMKGGLIFKNSRRKPTLKDISNRKLNPTYLSRKSKAGYNTLVADNLYALDDIFDSMWRWTLEVDLADLKGRKNHKYVYSDVDFYILQAIVERIAQQSLDLFLNTHFYRPLNLRHLGYLPRERFKLAQIVPTENDIYFRKQLVHGYVHDPGAALRGGVSGHAGLFGNTLDVAILLQMNLQQGYYGGRFYYPHDIISQYSKYHFADNESRRGLGWDKSGLDQKSYSPTAPEAPKETFGHTGFTGTCAWVDPKNKLIYVFLSNRIHLVAENKALLKLKIRRRIQSVIYQAFI